MFKLSLNSYAAKYTIGVLFFLQKRPKTIVIEIIVQDDKKFKVKVTAPPIKMEVWNSLGFSFEVRKILFRFKHFMIVTLV